MKIFFDTEFTGLHKNTTLISIGLIAGDGKTFYAELIDYDKKQVDEWIKNNVINNLARSIGELSRMADEVSHGKKENVQSDLLRWLNQYDSIEWVSDVCHYDFVLLIDLLYGHALKMPYGKHNAACHDINQDIAKHYGISEIEAFDKSREEIINEMSEIKISGEKHNALYDAKVIKVLYECLK